MTNVLQFRSLIGNASRGATPAAEGACAIIQFPSIAVSEAKAIDTAAAEGDLETMMKLALHGRSTDARNRAGVWLEEVFNVRVM